ncbi:MAG TPA: hypothetical protein PKA05_23020, partial [Roseiflexaceae bacterium]|nr:hypothetical protein [Roseiflexaceae bacterium]
IAASHPPAAAGEATRAMTEAIWNHSLLKADLAAAGITLLRPQVEIEQTSAHQPVPQTPVEPPPAAPPPASDADVFRWDLVAGHATPAADTPPFPPPSLPADSQEHESAAFRWDLVAGDSPPAAETFPRERQTQPEAAAAPDPTDDESAAFRWDLVNDEPPSPAGESQFRWGKASPPAPPPPPSPAAQPRQVFQWNQIEPVEPAVPPPAATSGSVWWNQMAQQSGVPASEPPAPVDEHMAERIESWVRKIRQQHGDQALTLVAHEPDNLPQLLANLGVPASECFYATDRYHQQALLFALRAQSTHQPKEPQP